MYSVAKGNSQEPIPGEMKTGMDELKMRGPLLLSQQSSRRFHPGMHAKSSDLGGRYDDDGEREWPAKILEPWRV